MQYVEKATGKVLTTKVKIGENGRKVKTSQFGAIIVGNELWTTWNTPYSPEKLGLEKVEA